MNQQPDNKAEIPLLTQHFEISAVVRPALIDDERPFYGLAGRGALQLLRVIAEAVAQIGFKAAAARMVLCVVPGPFPYRDTSRSTFVAFLIYGTGVVEGKSGYVREELGGCRIIKKKKTKQ